jgi:uncharacterized membrane-anchored protein
MNRRTYRWLIWGWLVVVLGVVNIGIAQKEHLLRTGTTVSLRLAPVDPRSLMQGDYMALRFAMGDKIASALTHAHPSDDARTLRAHHDGRVVIHLNADTTATLVALYTGQPLHPGEHLLRYRMRKGSVHFSTDAYFFQEGTADRYTQARYGVFKVDADGAALLIGLRDEQLQDLGR